MPHLKWTLLLYKCIYGADTNMLWTDGRTDRQPDCQTDNLTDGRTDQRMKGIPIIPSRFAFGDLKLNF